MGKIIEHQDYQNQKGMKHYDIPQHHNKSRTYGTAY